MFTLEKTSNEVKFHIICVNYLTNIKGGAGAGPNTPAPAPAPAKYPCTAPCTFELPVCATTRTSSKNKLNSRLDILYKVIPVSVTDLEPPGARNLCGGSDPS